MRLLSYNVRSLRDDRAAVVRVLRACAPDVVCVQEAPRFLRSRATLRRLAADAGLEYVCGGRRTHGPALLVGPGVQVHSSAEHSLPRTAGLHRRGLAVATLGLPGGGNSRVRVASMHLGLSAEERLRNVDALLGLLGLLSLLSADRAALVLAGDVNESPGGPAWQRLAEAGLHDAYDRAPCGGELTYPATAPRRRIDAVFVGGAVQVASCGVPRDAVASPDLVAATDHLPVLAHLFLD